MSLNDLRDEALRIATEHGFSDATPGEDMALIHSEVSEALEDIREGHAPSVLWYEEKDSAGNVTRHGEQAPGARMRKPCGVPSEMADIIIRVAHFCGKHGIDIASAVDEKMAYNNSRPFKHGKVL